MSREERRRDAGQRYGFGLFESPPCSAGHKQINMHSHPHWAGQEREREREGGRERKERERKASCCHCISVWGEWKLIKLQRSNESL